MKNNERRIYYYDASVKSSSKYANPPNMDEVIAAIKVQFDKGRAKHSILKGSATLEIGDISIDNERCFAILLVRISDTAAPDAFFSDPIKGTSRVERKQAGEGRGYAAHVLISTVETSGAPNNYLMVLEKNTGLHRHHIVRLIQAVLKDLYKREPDRFACDHIGGQRYKGAPKRVNFRPMLELLGHPSKSLVQELEKGTLKEVSLIHSEEGSQLGGKPWLKTQEKVLKVKASISNPIHNMWNQLVEVLKQQSENGYERARIKFKKDDNEHISLDIDTATGNSLDDRFVRTSRISDVKPLLDESSDLIVKHFADRMISLFLEARGNPV